MSFQYIGDCTQVLDNLNFANWATDATDLAQLVEKGQEISKEKFAELFSSIWYQALIKYTHFPTMSFWYIPNQDIAWMYDEKRDLHHFFVDFKR